MIQYDQVQVGWSNTSFCQLITAVGALPGNAPDNLGALDLVEESEASASYGDGGTRQTFAEAGRPNQKYFSKDDFVIDLAAGKRTDSTGRLHRLPAFQFDGAVCRLCLLRSQCIAAKGRKGRRVLIHPQEALLQQGRALQQNADYDQYREVRNRR